MPKACNCCSGQLKQRIFPGEDVLIAFDCAASEFYKDGKYNLAGEGLQLTSAQPVDYLANLAETFPIVSIEDGMAEGDWEGWNC